MLPCYTAGFGTVLARIVIAIFGGIAIAWGLATIPIFWREAPIEYIARHIIRGEPYKIEVLLRQIPAVEAVESSTFCRPIALWSAAIIRIRITEQDISNEDEKPIDAVTTRKLDNYIRGSLSCSAADPFLWLSLYWVETTQSRSKHEYSKYLRMSYQLGTNEGWIAIKRNPVAFANYEELPPDIATKVITEFLTLIDSGFYEQAVDILSGPAWRLHDVILGKVATLSRRSRAAFARSAYDRGLDVKMPGIELPYSKPPDIKF